MSTLRSDRGVCTIEGVTRGSKDDESSRSGRCADVAALRGPAAPEPAGVRAEHAGIARLAREELGVVVVNRSHRHRMGPIRSSPLVFDHFAAARPDAVADKNAVGSGATWRTS